MAAEQLGSRDAGYLLETTLAELEEESSSRSTKSVLHHLQNPATTQVGVTLFDSECHHGVNHVLKLLATCHLTRLVHLIDDDSIAEVLFAVVGDLLQGTGS